MHERSRNVKFQPDFLDGVNTIARHDRSGVWVGAQAHRAA